MDKFTEEDLDVCWPHHKVYLLEIFNGEYDLDEARKDLRGLIGSKYDSRTKPLPYREVWEVP
jgi:hypothetical protein